MKRLLIAALVAFPMAAVAAKKPVPLAPNSGAALAGKTVVVTRHEIPSFVAFTPGKAQFALFGAGPMIAAGHKIVRDNEVPDPADIIERELIPVVAEHYGFQIKSGPPPMITVTKPKEVVATQPDVDYLLDLQSIGWQYSYYPTIWGKYWTVYSIKATFIERASGKVLGDAFCSANDKGNPAPPTQDALLENKAQLLKDVTSGLAWICLRQLAKDEFLLPEGEVPAIPAGLVDPLAAYAATHK